MILIVLDSIAQAWRAVETVAHDLGLSAESRLTAARSGQASNGSAGCFAAHPPLSLPPSNEARRGGSTNVPRITPDAGFDRGRPSMDDASPYSLQQPFPFPPPSPTPCACSPPGTAERSSTHMLHQKEDNNTRVAPGSKMNAGHLRTMAEQRKNQLEQTRGSLPWEAWEQGRGGKRASNRLPGTRKPGSLRPRRTSPICGDTSSRLSSSRES